MRPGWTARTQRRLTGRSPRAPRTAASMSATTAGRGARLRRARTPANRHVHRDGEGEEDDEGDHRRVDVCGRAGPVGAQEGGGEQEAGEDAGRDGRVDGPVLDVGGDERAALRPPEGEDDERADRGRDGCVGDGGTEVHRPAAARERDDRVEEGKGGDAEDEQALHRVDQRLEEDVAERIALVVGALDQRRDAQGQEGRREEAEVEEAVEQDRARTAQERHGEAEHADQERGAGGQPEGGAFVHRTVSIGPSARPWMNCWR